MKMLLPGLLVALLSVAAISTKSRPERLLNRPVPRFEGRTLGGKHVDAAYFTGKVTLVNFMYIGCPPCMAELPVLARLRKQLDAQRVQVLTIAPHTAQQLRDFNGDASTIQGYLRQQSGAPAIENDLLPECTRPKPGDGFTLGPECSTISDKFYVDGYPLSLLVDAHGIVRRVYEGFPMEAKLLAKHEQMLKDDIAALLAR